MNFKFLDCLSDTNFHNRPRGLGLIITEIPLWTFAMSLKGRSKIVYLREILNNPHDIEGGYEITKKK